MSWNEVLFSFQFHDNIIHNIKVAHQIEQRTLVMQQLISFTFLKNIKSSFWRYIQTFRKLGTYPTYLHPKLRIS